MKVYDIIFGKERGSSLFVTNEKKKENSFLIYKWCSISSLAYFVLSIYMFLATDKYRYLSYAGALRLLTLSFSSFFWWGSQRLRVHKLDIFSYSSMLYWVGLYLLGVLYPEKEKMLAIIFFLISLPFMWYVLEIGTQHKQLIKVFNILSSLFSCVVLVKCLLSNNLPINKYYLSLGLFLFLMGFYFKLSDTFSFFFRIFKEYGTAIFHILTSLGIFFMWIATQ